MRAQPVHNSISPSRWFSRRVPFPLAIRQRPGPAPQAVRHCPHSCAARWISNPLDSKNGSALAMVLTELTSALSQPRLILPLYDSSSDGKRGTARLSPTSTYAAHLRAKSRFSIHIDCGAPPSVTNLTAMMSHLIMHLSGPVMQTQMITLAVDVVAGSQNKYPRSH